MYTVILYLKDTTTDCWPNRKKLYSTTRNSREARLWKRPESAAKWLQVYINAGLVGSWKIVKVAPDGYIGW